MHLPEGEAIRFCMKTMFGDLARQEKEQPTGYRTNGR